MSPSCHLLFQHCSLLLSVFCKHSVFNKGVYLQGLKTLRKQSFLGNFTVTDYRVSHQLSLQQFGSMSETISRVRQLTEKGSKMEGWDDCWKAGLTPWDRGSSLPILCELCKEDALPNGYALVPGCGRGYDVLTLASAARVAIGLDCSEEAKKQAEQLRDSRGVPSQRAQFVVGNFFDFPFSQKFDLVYDLTFFCALPPESRNSWANRMKEIIQVDGELVTVVFPIGDYEGGPPYAMNLDIYKQLLEPLGFESFYMKNISDQLPPSSIFVRWKLRH